MSEITCRKATEADLAAIVELWLEMMAFHRDAVPFPLVENAAALSEEFMKQRLAQHDCLVLVAVSDGKTIGFCRSAVANYPPVFEAPPYGSINELAVSSEYRRQGVGEALYLATKEWFLSKGITRLEVGTASANPVSNAFWGKMGFETYRETKQLDL